MSIFQVPASWDCLYSPDVPLTKTTPFWACLISVIYALVSAIGLAKVVTRQDLAVLYALPAISLMGAAIVFLGWCFFHHVEGIRGSLADLEASQAKAILVNSRTITRLFYSFNLVVGMVFLFSSLVLRH